MIKKLLTVSITGLATTAFSQNPVAGLKHQIDSIVYPYIKQYSIAGMSVGIVNNRESYTLNYGQTAQKNGFPVTDSTMFYTASVTKVFTATAIMHLTEKGLLSLDDKLADILPEFKLKSSDYDRITVRHLLTHTSGLPWVNKQKNLPDDSTSTAPFLDGLKRVKLKFAPGEKFSGETYSNIAFDLLGIVISRVSKQNYHDYIYQNILSKIGMNNATYFYEKIDSSKLALPQVVAGDSKKIRRFNLYRIDNKKNPVLNGGPLDLRNYEIYGEQYIDNPAGNLITTSGELNKWAKYLIQLNNSTAENTQGIISKKTLSEMWTVRQTISGYKISLGITWWIFDNSDLGRYICHFGNNPGFCSILFIFPEHDFGINILCNGMYAQEAVFNKIPLEIAKLIIKK